jgi:hypothetical protein
LEKWVILELGKEIHQICLEYCVVLESKKILKERESGEGRNKREGKGRKNSLVGICQRDLELQIAKVETFQTTK